MSAANPPFSVPFVRWADTVRVEAGGAGTRPRQIYDHELVYVMEGEGEIILDGQTHPARLDSLFLVRPRVYHSFLSPIEPQRLLGVHFDWEARPDTADFSSHRPVGNAPDWSLFRPAQNIENWDVNAQPSLDLRGRVGVRRALEAVVTEWQRADALAPVIAGALLAAALGQIAREAQLLHEVAAHQSAPPDAVRRVQLARELLELPEAPLLSIEQIAAQVGWSGDHLRRMCRAILGSGPLEIQSAARVRRAGELLRYGGLRWPKSPNVWAGAMPLISRALSKKRPGSRRANGLIGSATLRRVRSSAARRVNSKSLLRVKLFTRLAATRSKLKSEIFHRVVPRCVACAFDVLN